MGFAFAKRYAPRSLYGRAALILLVPVVTLQLVISVVFIQRHFEDVTEQMTRSVALELRYLLHAVDTAPDAKTARAALMGLAEPLAFRVALPAAPGPGTRRAFYDFSGRQLIATLAAEVPAVRQVDLTASSREVWLWIDTRHGQLSVIFDRRRVTASNPHQLLVLMVFIGLLMTLIAYVFLRNQLRPITRLAAASEAFGKGRIEPYRPAGATEVRAAGAAFLDMRARIERQIEQRTMMLSGVSHDLRTPLTRLKLGLSLQEGSAETEALMHDVTDMQRLLDEFLAFARGDALDDPEDCDPREVVSTVVNRYRAAGQPVDLAGVRGEGRTLLRPMAVARALDNLIGNAIRYGRTCEVRLTISDRKLRISVEDDGPGIPEDRRGEAMKPFSRLDLARNQDQGGGVGLGLAIAGDIARRHGGFLLLDQSPSLGGLKAVLVLAR